MSVTVHSAYYDAMESSLIQVECGFGKGYSGIAMISHVSEVVKHGIERARTALESLGMDLSQKRTVISLAPADLRKDGSHFDLAFVVGLAILNYEKDKVTNHEGWIFTAEVGLDGTLRPVKGIVSFALTAVAEKMKGLVIARENLADLAAFSRLQASDDRTACRFMAFDTVAEVLAWVIHNKLPGVQVDTIDETDLLPAYRYKPNFDDMILDPSLEQVALTSAVGLHSILLYGTPGTGKSMFSARLTSIMPPITGDHHIEALKIHSLCHQRLPSDLLAGKPPFRSPHHQASPAAIMGIPESPGEISLAHGGILFLDEFPEFRRDIIEALREPLESGSVQVSRAKKKVLWKSRITLVAACNPCPCGWLGSQQRRCQCPTAKILSYRRRISGPVLDRIDIHINVMELPEARSRVFLRLRGSQGDAYTEGLAQRVIQARAFGAERNAALGVLYNRDLQAEHMFKASGLDEDAFKDLLDASSSIPLSRRAVIRSLRVARTLADLDRSLVIRSEDLAQAWRWMPSACAHERGDAAYGISV